MARSVISLVLIALLFQAWTLACDDCICALQKKTNMVAKRVDELEDVIAEMDKTLKKLQTEVSYEVKLTPDITYAANEAFTFDDIMYNIGEGYNNNSGNFTAPVTGTYLLWAHIMQNAVNYMSLHIVGSKGVLLRGFISGGSGYHGVASVSGVVYLAKDENVYITSPHSKPLRGNGFSSFGGTLLKAH